ncbi:YggS family pyridoxal phosphate-dependent enzyme [Motiliproteus sp. SC1-56]|uniref:YggS family pyridoxal phosphate-dependent enzyme n=1 Tax=Motiliproteus sp. SC1-56 TaxID=2799565 RepID=UPI001A904E46|nr:YggS family pyridoxal phosphate-dependent enzyme [Motiliproteus sp. SC1-56]
MFSITENISRTLTLIREAELRAGRPEGAVRLLAVSKTKPARMVREAASAGQRDFGENYLQDALDKMAQLTDLDLVWHFIGPLQSNKTRAVAEHFDWVHSIDRLKIARRLSEQRPVGLPPLNVCLQVNISGEANKAGVTPDEAPALAEAIVKLPNLMLRGLMAIPRPETEQAAQRHAFSQLRQLQERLKPQAPTMDTLSMGMSGDMDAAIAEGSTLVRIGTALFGARD